MARAEDMTVLVVDDEPDVLGFLQSALEDAGFTVLTASDGDEAIEQLKTNKIDFISLDLVMPNKSGARCLYEIRKNRQWSKIPVVVVTGHARDELGRSDFEEIFSGKTISGPQVYLEKPVKARDYVNMVKRQVGIEVDEPQEEASKPEEIKEDLKNMLNGADLDTLQKIQEMLKKKKDS
ncbi:MAG: response regulator [Planctomycetes bacterium]|nr:response regulator [Planctomycetota bacterium]